MNDDAAEALVTGTAPAGRPDLAMLARSIAEFRGAALATPPQPTAELRARLGLESEFSPAHRNPVAGSLDASDATRRRPVAHTGRLKRLLAWLAGLGLAAKIVLGVSVAAAAGVTGVGAAVGIDAVVSTTSEHEQVETEDAPDEVGETEGKSEGESPGDTDGDTDAPAEESDTFGDSVSDRAHELGKDGDGKAFGEEISEEAQQLGNDKAQKPEQTGRGTGEGPGNAPELPEVARKGGN